MTYENVTLAREEGLAILTVNRPKSLNALNRATIAELTQAVDEIAADKAVRALILTGAGEKAFVAGADIAEMAALSSPEALEFSRAGHRLMDRLEALPIPTLAAVNGFALGGGCELALACDLIVASEKARFGQPEVSLGVIPGFGGTGRLTRAVGIQRARELIFTGDIVDAQGALALGLVVAVVLAEQLLDRCRDIARRVAQKGPLAIAQAKRVLRAGADLPLDAANALEMQAFAALFGSSDQKEGMRAFLDKRPPHFEGH
jgi:enoyl-CoA hydratase